MYGIDFGEEVDVWNGDFVVLVVVLFFVGYLVFDLDVVGVGFDYFFG